MAGERWLGVAAAVLAVLALGGGARADIINGDFSNEALDGSAGWVIAYASNADPLRVLVEVADGQLHVMTSNTWNWTVDEYGQNGQWVCEEPVDSAAAIMQVVQPDEYGYYAPANTTAIEFDAEITISGNPASNVGPESAGVRFDVQYHNNSGTTGLVPLGDIVPMQTLRVEMPYLVANSEDGIQLILTASSALAVLPAAPGDDDPLSFTIEVNAYFDNFHFVPEPMSAGLLLAGAALLVLRRRRRLA